MDGQCRPVPAKGKSENPHWTTFLEDRDDDSGHAEKLAKTMKRSNKISLGDSDVGLFRCKKLDASENQCACCYLGRYGIMKPNMSKHRMTAEHTCRLHGLKKSTETKYRVKMPLPEKVEGGLAKNKFWEEVEKPKVSQTFKSIYII